MQLINVDDFEKYAKRKLPANIYDYYAAGAGDEWTLARNLESFKKILILPRVLKNISLPTTQINLLGKEFTSPILIAPTAFQQAAHPEGEIATAKAAANAGIGMIVSTMSTTTLEDIAQTVDPALLWFQLYMQKDRFVSKQLVERAEKAGYQAIVLTVDTPIMGKRERDLRNNFCLPENLKAKNFADTLEINQQFIGSAVKNHTDSFF